MGYKYKVMITELWTFRKCRPSLRYATAFLRDNGTVDGPWAKMTDGTTSEAGKGSHEVRMRG